MTFRRLAPALALSFLMVSCAVELTPQQKAQQEQQRRAAAAKKRAQAEKKNRVHAEAERKKRERRARFDKILKEIKRLRQAGKAAEKNGKLRKAFELYNGTLKQYFAWIKLFDTKGKKLSEEKRQETLSIARWGILRVAAKLDPPPAIPPAVERHSIRASTFLKTARNKEGFNRVIAEYNQALEIAPWWADGYFNLALVFEKMDQIDTAILNIKLYLTGKPSAPDTKAVKRKLIALEAMSEQIAPYKAWLGKWGNAKVAALVMKLNGDELSLVFVKIMDDESYKESFRPGDAFLSGKLDGKTLRGKIFIGSESPEFNRCFGKKSSVPATATLSSDGRTLKIKYKTINTYYPKTCRIKNYRNKKLNIGKLEF